MDLIIFALATLGLCNVLVISEIAQPIRDVFEANDKDGKLLSQIRSFFQKILGCHMCCGWWSGLFCSLVLYGFDWRMQFFGAFGGSFICYFLFLIQQAIETHTILNYPEETDGH